MAVFLSLFCCSHTNSQLHKAGGKHFEANISSNVVSLPKFCRYYLNKQIQSISLSSLALNNGTAAVVLLQHSFRMTYFACFESNSKSQKDMLVNAG
jgi:hypothetical protein